MAEKRAARYEYTGAEASHEYVTRDEHGNVTERRFLVPGETLTEDELSPAQFGAFRDRFKDLKPSADTKTAQGKAITADAKVAEAQNDPQLVQETSPVPAGAANVIQEAGIVQPGEVPKSAGQITADLAAKVDKPK
jgi:hypothetical protein